MDFRLDDDQLALRDATRSLCAARGVPPADDPWGDLAELGVFGLLVPVQGGGLGAGPVEAAVVLEQLGAHLVPGPVVWSVITAPILPEVARGDVRVTGALAEEAGVIEHAARSDTVVIAYGDRVEAFPASRLRDAPAGSPFDPLTPAIACGRPPTGDVVGGPDEARRLRHLGTVLTAAMLVGLAQGALDVAAAYALERRQFGVPIGSFQAVKHMLADMYVRTELARSACYAAAAVADDDRGGDAARSASTAKLLAGEAAITNGRTAVQVLGGMGFSWAMLPHYYLKRAWVLEQSFGSGGAHALALGDGLESWT